MKNPLVSIIIPIYNVEECLEECLESVTSQINSNQEVEVLLINDATTDNSMHIAKRYEEKYDFVKIINLSINQGLSIARNTGIRESSGDWLWFVDSDDRVEPDTLQPLLSEIREHKDNDVICIQKRNCLTTWKEFVNYNDILPSPLQMDGKQYLRSNLQKTASIKFIVKRRFLNDFQLEFYPKLLHEDVLFNYTMLYHTRNIYVLNQFIYGRRLRRPGSITNTTGLKNANDMIFIHKKLMEFRSTIVDMDDRMWFFEICFWIIKEAYNKIDRYYNTPLFSEFYIKNKDYIKSICSMALLTGDKKMRRDALLLKYCPRYIHYRKVFYSRIKKLLAFIGVKKFQKV